MLINLIMLGILTSMPSSLFAWDRKDSLILSRIYDYPQHHHPYSDSITDNVYVKFRFNVEKRNPTLWLIPTMYVLAKDERQYIRETYNKILYTNEHDYDIVGQVKAGTIRHNRKAMPTLRAISTARTPEWCSAATSRRAMEDTPILMVRYLPLPTRCILNLTPTRLTWSL